MNVEQCRATVFLHEPLRQSLQRWLGGNEVASMQRCTLDGGHRGEHVGLPDADGTGSLRWDECGFHVGSANRWRREHRTESTIARPTGGRHAVDTGAAEAPKPHPDTQALWALTAAVERLAASISAAREKV
ncbi:hypothetical protein [Mycobacterium sp. IDR2000157661]|uniref:hypothetical protein n=1 Tax=Mycobacterium sp. IDR2000157661 TaxID=2867005 RepID=UPI001EEAE9C8|nr:hypothetical protein [Mycobacterium sp. IDR2000157661]ULE34065.1 hypothetical protein K3G64_05185 [Mycobacterium sp. IDR2000157661]